MCHQRQMEKFQNQIEVLESMGRWLKKNGESIYGTEAWYRFGEGPTVQPEGHFKNRDIFHKLEYSSKDIRYSKKLRYLCYF